MYLNMLRYSQLDKINNLQKYKRINIKELNIAREICV